MKTKAVPVLLLMLGLTIAAAAQTVTITSRKITYRRPRPSPEFKKTFTVNYPQIKAATPALSKKIEREISYQKVSGLDLKEEMGEVQWLEEADYEVLYNDHDVLCITLYLTGSGAYPSTSSKTVVIDTKTGARATPAIVFTDLTGLAAMIKYAQQAEMKEAA
jgi:hypothetical protein